MYFRSINILIKALIIIITLSHSSHSYAIYWASKVLNHSCNLKDLKFLFKTDKIREVKNAKLMMASKIIEFFTKAKDPLALAEEDFISPAGFRPSKIKISTFHNYQEDQICLKSKICFRYFIIEGKLTQTIACLQNKIHFFSFRDESNGKKLTRFMNNNFGLPLKRTSIKDSGEIKDESLILKKINDSYTLRQKASVTVVIGSHKIHMQIINANSSNKTKQTPTTNFGYNIMYMTEEWITYLTSEIKLRQLAKNRNN